VAPELLGALIEALSHRAAAHCRRQPLDNCLSCYFTSFAEENPFARRWQVRQPIYSQSVDRWRHYEPYLDELRHALGPLAASNDINTTPQE
jgi:hypothetical protein